MKGESDRSGHIKKKCDACNMLPLIVFYFPDKLPEYSLNL